MYTAADYATAITKVQPESVNAADRPAGTAYKHVRLTLESFFRAGANVPTYRDCIGTDVTIKCPMSSC